MEVTELLMYYIVHVVYVVSTFLVCPVSFATTDTERERGGGGGGGGER